MNFLNPIYPVSPMPPGSYGKRSSRLHKKLLVKIGDVPDKAVITLAFITLHCGELV
jgi:hypothetical protein